MAGSIIFNYNDPFVYTSSAEMLAADTTTIPAGTLVLALSGMSGVYMYDSTSHGILAPGDLIPNNGSGVFIIQNIAVLYLDNNNQLTGFNGAVDIPVPPTQGGTGTETVFTQGSIVFAGMDGVYTQDNANLSFDDTTKTLAVENITTTGVVLLSTSVPTFDLEAASKKYVDDSIQAKNIKDPCQAATVTNFVATYNNGASGVGATLTQITPAVYAPDGVTLALNNSILVKNQSSSFQNGIYTITTLGTNTVAAVLTRRADMDEADDFIFATILILGGTQINQTWSETSVVNTIGTDPVTFIQVGAGTSGTVTSITFSSPLTGGTITTSGTVGLGTVNVTNGGTGLTLSTPYALYCGGTTSTTALQQVTSNGITGQILQSQGPTALPAFSTATYPLTTTVNQILYSSANNTVDQILTTANGVLVTSSGGIPSISTTLPAGLTIPGYLTTALLYAGIWNSATTYSINDVVLASNNNQYVSVANNNIDVNPINSYSINTVTQAILTPNLPEIYSTAVELGYGNVTFSVPGNITACYFYKPTEGGVSSQHVFNVWRNGVYLSQYSQTFNATNINQWNLIVLTNPVVISPGDVGVDYTISVSTIANDTVEFMNGSPSTPYTSTPDGLVIFGQYVYTLYSGTTPTVPPALPSSTFASVSPLIDIQFSPTQNWELMGYGLTPLPNAEIFVGNASSVATPVAMSGDATISNVGALILSTVNSNVGTFQGLTVNAKGLVTAATNQNYLSNSLLSGDLFIGNGSNIATGMAMSGDATISNSGALTIGNSKITYAKIQSEAATTLLGNPTGSSAAPSEITLGTNLSFSGSVLNANSALPALPSAEIFVGNGSNVATAVSLSGDATLSNSGVLTVANNAITYAKIQSVSSAKLLGNPTGSGATVSEITLGTGLSFSGSTLNATGSGSGTVTSITFSSPLTGGTITTSGTVGLGTVGTGNGGTGTTTTFTSGSIIFAGTSGIYSTDANLIWNNTSKWMGIGMSPVQMLSVAQTIHIGSGLAVLPTSGQSFEIVPTSGSASFLLSRPTTTDYASCDMISTGNVSTGWSMQLPGLQTYWQLLDRAANLPRIVCLTNGNVGFGTTTPTTIIQAAGTITATAFSGSGASLTSLNGTNVSSGIVSAAVGGTGVNNGSNTLPLGTSTPTSGNFLIGNGTAWVSTAASAVMATFINGFIPSYSSGSTTHFSAGSASDSTNAVIISSATTLSNSLGSSGANGLDTGAAAASTFYYFYVIKGTSGIATLASISATSPTLPSGYTFFRRVGTGLTDGGGNLRVFYYTGSGELRTFWYVTYPAVLTAGTASSFTVVNIGGFVPPIFPATKVILSGGIATLSGAGILYVSTNGASPGTACANILTASTGAQGIIETVAESVSTGAMAVTYYVLGSGANAALLVGGWEDYV